jgi:hypothetical protein
MTPTRMMAFFIVKGSAWNLRPHTDLHVLGEDLMYYLELKTESLCGKLQEKMKAS